MQLNAAIFQYADDTALLISHESYSEAVKLLQEDAIRVIDWLHANQIYLNKEKTTIICFRNPHKTVSLDLSIQLHGFQCLNCSCISLPLSPTVKYLGLHFDDRMLWDVHIDYIMKRLRTVAAQLYTLKFNTPVKLRRLVFKALGQSVLRYGISVFGSCSQTKVDRVDKLLHRIAASILYGTAHDCSDRDARINIAGVESFSDLFVQVILLRNIF